MQHLKSTASDGSTVRLRTQDTDRTPPAYRIQVSRTSIAEGLLAFCRLFGCEGRVKLS